ncbi:MAG: SAVED domain-containing protein [Acidobacteria bacterium]|nr:SAVED domain-containing protein [Acidobacteriota bacterium]
MANAVVARNQGDEYQARFFWLSACRLFQSHTKVVRVGYEIDKIKSFDDVVVAYATPLRFERGDPVATDYFQIKFHVNQAGAFTCDALTDPKFINASKISFLKKLHDAQRLVASNGAGCRFIIVSPWGIHPDDLLAAIINNNGGEVRLEVLFDGKKASKMSRVRAKWKSHLGLTNDDELAAVLRPLRLYINAPGPNQINDLLNLHLENVGFVPIEAGKLVHPYDDLIRKLKAQGRNEFTRDELREICARENLWRGRAQPVDGPGQIGIRSFMRFAEHMEDETEDMIDLVSHFDNRCIRAQDDWSQVILPKVSAFLSKYARLVKPYNLLLDTHSSIAFAAGYCLEIKSGANVVPVEQTRTGKEVWSLQSDTHLGGRFSWTKTNQSISSKGHDVAVAISITHDVFNDVQDFVIRKLPQVGRIIHCHINPQPGNTAVCDGTHAFALAQELTTLFKQRTREERDGSLHLFAAAPNAFMFFLGQLAHGFGTCVLYEYDFESNALGAYQPSITFSRQPC